MKDEIKYFCLPSDQIWTPSAISKVINTSKFLHLFQAIEESKRLVDMYKIAFNIYKIQNGVITKIKTT